MALITYLTRIQFDFGAIKLLPDEMKLAGIARPLLVTDKGVVAAGIAARVAAAMAPAPVATFDGTPSNPTERATKEALEQYRAQGCDGVVAVGGGSSMDLAKAVALMATHPGRPARSPCWSAAAVSASRWGHASARRRSSWTTMRAYTATRRWRRSSIWRRSSVPRPRPGPGGPRRPVYRRCRVAASWRPI